MFPTFANSETEIPEETTYYKTLQGLMEVIEFRSKLAPDFVCVTIASKTISCFNSPIDAQAKTYQEVGKSLQAIQDALTGK